MARLSGAEVAGSLMPAYDVGGDWFDHAENSEGAWLGVADAVGRGTNAAAISAVAIGAFRAARRARQGLEECCVAIDDAVSALGAGAFVTAVIATWQPETRIFAWINCGHPLPILIRPRGEVDELAGEGTLPLGLTLGQAPGFRRNEQRLAVGDRVLLYSDGVTDQHRSDGGLLGLESLLELLRSWGNRSAAETVIAVEGHLRTHGPAKLGDDATMLALAATG
jgi:serine phosphatase RsbU (regulator of sigma subunit)